MRRAGRCFGAALEGAESAGRRPTLSHLGKCVKKLQNKSSQGNTETAERVQEHGDRQTGGPSGAQQASQGELGTVAVWGPTAQPTLIRSVSRWPLALSGVVYSRNQI